MNVSKRLERAVNKLYVAFHNNQLNPECCKHCAVGNICNNTDSWKHLTDIHGSLILNYVGRVHESLGRKLYGYSPMEILQIEATFLWGCGYTLPLNQDSKKPSDPTSKETLFNGLCAVVEYLCKLDGVSNVMDYSKLFEYENKAEHKEVVLSTH